MQIPNVFRVFFGIEIADIWSLSKFVSVIGSDSTFSGWGIYLGQIPCVFAHKHYGPILKENSNEFIVAKNEHLPSELEIIISKL